MADTRLERWVELQRKTWDVDEGARASRILIQQQQGELIQGFSTELPDLGRVLQECLDMQADELPAGSSYPFRVVSVDSTGKQLSELPQTVRGKSKDANTANQHALQQSRAHHQDIDTMSFVLDRTTQQLEQVSNRLGELFDDCTALAESNATMRLNNEESLLRRLEFEASVARRDKLWEALGQLAVPVGTILLEKLGPKFLGATPGEMLTKVSTAIDKLAETNLEQAKTEPETNEGAADGERTGPTEKPVDAIVPELAQPRPRTFPRSSQGRGTRNDRPVPAKRRAKAPAAKTQKRK